MPRLHKQEIFTCGAFALALFVLLWLRRPDSLLNAQFWAEDGGVFFREQTLFGFWGALTRPYSGYLHVIPRMITAIVCELPVRWVPLGMNSSALLLEAISCSAFFWPCYRRVIASDMLRATCCLIATTSIVAGNELVATLSNVQWFLCILSLLLILVAGKGFEIALTSLQVCIAFTAPITLLYAPFLAWQLKSNPPRLRLRPLIHLLALLAQCWIMREGLMGPKPVLRFNSVFLSTFGAGVSRCVIAPLLGWRFLREASDVAFFTTVAVGVIAGTILLTLLSTRLYRTQQMKWLLGAGYVGVGSLAAVLVGRKILSNFLTMEGMRHYTAERYFFIGACMFIFTLALAVDSFLPLRKASLGAPVLGALFAWGAVHNFSADTLTDFQWQENAAKIEQWKAARRRHEKTDTLVVPINPNLHLILD